MKKILIACEESQAVCKAFRARGFEAYSCDIQDCSGGHPEWDIKGDVLEVLNQDWDMIIAHPPCTYLSNAGATTLFPQKGILNQERYDKAMEAKEFFMTILNTDCPYICVENPVPTRIFGLPKYTQIIEPFQFGHHWRKRTCLWLKGLPNLIPTNIITENIQSWVSSGTTHKRNKQKGQETLGHCDAKTRSKTFSGIAEAMAQQWGDFILQQSKER